MSTSIPPLSLAEQISYLSLKDNFELGRQYFKDGSYDKAMPCLVRVPRSHPEYGEALYLLGFMHLSVYGNRESAKVCFDDVPSSHPRFPDAQMELAKMRAQAQHWNYCLVHSNCALESSFASDKTKDQARLLCAKALYFQEYYMEAIEYLNAFLKSPSASDEDKNHAHLLCGRAMYYREDYLHAIEHLEKVKLSEDNTAPYNVDYHDAQLFLGKSYFELGNYDKAINYLQIASKIGHCVVIQENSHYFLGFCLYQIGKPREAEAMFEKVPLSANNNNHAEAQHMLVIIRNG